MSDVSGNAVRRDGDQDRDEKDGGDFAEDVAKDDAAAQSIALALPGQRGATT